MFHSYVSLPEGISLWKWMNIPQRGPVSGDCKAAKGRSQLTWVPWPGGISTEVMVGFYQYFKLVAW